MHPLITYPYTEIALRFNRILEGHWQHRARQLRGALARLFSDDNRFHQHDDSGQVLYRYPPILYRWSRGRALIAGWGEAARLLPNLPWLELDLVLGEESVAVDDALIRCHSAIITYSPRLHPYRLSTPVLLFNQDNYPRFQAMKTADRQQELDRLLTAQLLIALRNLGAEIPGHLYVTFVDARSQRCRLKQQQLLGFSGRLVCNLTLPSGFAFGHAVSHGYGWIVPEQEIQ
ncbi:MAG: CRISPR-associated endonuclease Cas6 [Pseudomonadota bacterium]|nr:CRISPR-associated endonuclease Cas6 [Pseudomonadota bacterium]